MSDSNVQREKVFEQVVKIMADTLEISPEEISADLSFNSDLPLIRSSSMSSLSMSKRHTISAFLMKS